MKKFFLAVASLFTFIGIASADNDRIISFEQLPAKSQEFIKKYFPDEKVSYVKEESDFMELSYEAVLATGTKIEFVGSGEWKEVECRYSTLNEEIVPVQIREYVRKNFPETKFVPDLVRYLEGDLRISGIVQSMDRKRDTLEKINESTWVIRRKYSSGKKVWAEFIIKRNPSTKPLAYYQVRIRCGKNSNAFKNSTEFVTSNYCMHWLK